jgi:hypothetical protein
LLLFHKISVQQQTRGAKLEMNNLFKDSQVEIISVHVHKTAGGTFGRILKQVYGEMQVFGDYQQQEKLENTLDRLSDQPQARVIHGHFPARKYKEYFPSAKRVIWLRNPIIQFIYGYFFGSRSPKKMFFLMKNISIWLKITSVC